MCDLSISLLGPMQVRLAGKPITTFESNRVRALLAYLAVEVMQPHHRQKLATLLWPDWPDAAARKNLRSALANLRKAIGDAQADPPFLLITRETIQFNPVSHCQLDVALLLQTTEPTAQAPIAQMEAAVVGYQGEFMEGFSLPDSPPFEEWLLLTRERMQRKALVALQQMTDHYQKTGEIERALHYARQQIVLDAFCDEAHCHLMLLLATAGQSSAALTHYEQYRTLLATELEAQPIPALVDLYAQIRDGTFVTPSLVVEVRREQPHNVPMNTQSPTASPPLPLPRTAQQPQSVQTHLPFVARQLELTQLRSHLKTACSGQGKVVFVAGDAGSGKTRFLQAFARSAQAEYTDLLIAGGSCSAHTGIGDPYLPFREILRILTGEVDTKWWTGTTAKQQIAHFRRALPLMLAHLVRDGPALLTSLIQTEALLTRLAEIPAPADQRWQQLATQIRGLLQQTGNGNGTALHQTDLFEQTTAFLYNVAHAHPLLLLIDDLQWADPGSISLLFHLGRHLTNAPILIVGAYRPEEIAAGRFAERHPLEPLLHEFGRLWGTITVDLNAADGRQFVNALLNQFPHRLDATFGDMLYQRSRGHALFTTELLVGLQSQGELFENEQGYWVAAGTVDWAAMPARIDATIGERIGRVPSRLHRVLSVASVQGETFVAEVVAQLLQLDERELITLLSEELDRKHQLVQAQGIDRTGERRLARYRFHHILFQEFLYQELDEVERAYWHEATAQVLETYYAAVMDDNISYITQLAWHFQAAGDMDKAIDYLAHAGSRAVALFANVEAVTHFKAALALLQTMPATPSRSEQELAIHEELVVAMSVIEGHAAPAIEPYFLRAETLAGIVNDPARRFAAAWRTWQYYQVRGDLHTALIRAQHLLTQVDPNQKNAAYLAAQQAVGIIAYPMGEVVTARLHLEESLIPLSAAEEQRYIQQHGTHPGVLTRVFLTPVLCYLGYPSHAAQTCEEALRLAEQADHPFSRSFALVSAFLLYQLQRNPKRTLYYAEQTIAFCQQHEILQWLHMAGHARGWARTLLNQPEEGIGEATAGFQAWQATGATLWGARMRAISADACLHGGQYSQAQTLIEEALACVERTGERLYEAELYRLKGELLRQQTQDEPPLVEIEACFQNAIASAQKQQAKFWELRATVSLSRLWIAQGKQQAAQRQLAQIYGWFTEGYETVDLQAAQTLLLKLQQP